ncbi:MAG: hypothetical protein JSV16_08025 [Candidatus Hydrogenedentota bacterium]|nr:MAG: hypothetical protein JSV16_08025 [Candidatus Hydrogenedentota bacterium]
MAGTVTVSEETFGTVKKLTWSWTSDASGDASGTTSTNAYSGAISRLVTVPDGVDAPTVNYDVVVNDEDSTDVLMGGGQNRSDTATEQVLASSLGFVANDKLALVVSGAGNAKKGTVYIYVR